MIDKSAVTNTTAQPVEESAGPARMVGNLGPPQTVSGPSRSRRKKQTTNETIDFVFVNEANDSPEFKAWNNRRVRSQARSHSHTAARLLKQEHKAKLRPLAPQERGQDPSRFLPHENFCPLATLDRQTAASSTNELFAHSQALFSADHASLTGDLSRVDIPLPVLELSHESINTNTLEAPLYYSHSDLAFCCTICGAHNDSIGATSKRSSNSLLPSPREILGAGRVDPFLSYPVERPNSDIHELLDLYFTYVLPSIYPDDHQSPLDSVKSVATAWLSTSMANPFLFNIFLWIICVKRDFIRGSKTSCNSAQALAYKVDGIKQLNKVISNEKKTLTDEVILAISGLATHEVVKVTEEKIKPFNSPLQSSGLLNIYGGMQMVPEHRNAMLKLIALRGGIDNLALTGLAECMVIGEVCGVLNSCFTLRPVFPPLRFHEPYITAVKKWATTLSPPSSHPKLGKAFRQLPKHVVTDMMLEILECMESITIAIDYYLKGKRGGLTLGQIVRTRTGIQKQLLLLPTAEELNINLTPLPRPNLYESCRLTAMIFSIAVIFPIPNTYDVLQTLVQGLATSLEPIHIKNHSEKCLEALLWMLTLGGIAALDKPERPWFVSNIALIGVERLKLDWEGVEDVLKTFLWLESACSPSGRQLWDEVIFFASSKPLSHQNNSS